MKPIDKQHIAEPALVVLDITGGDEDTVQAVMTALGDARICFCHLGISVGGPTGISPAQSSNSMISI
ncbi:DUF6207 family protein [Streptomyces sp. NPDC051366]|uniref:DUF6207 family protein n=1 Tax=Streptomyces sp. NPDC051366 TaxID=3365652 RepID=UPI00379A64EC